MVGELTGNPTFDESLAGTEVVSFVEGERWFLTGRMKVRGGLTNLQIAVPDYYIYKQGDGTHTQYRYLLGSALKPVTTKGE